MPKRSPEHFAARRAAILAAARACFAERGFHATTISHLSAATGVSAGGIYTHFPSKLALAEAIAGQPEPTDGGPDEVLALFDGLMAPAGETDARVDLHLWSAALSEPALHAHVTEHMDGFRAAVGEAVGADDAHVALIEAIALGLEVQRALGRAVPAGLRARLAALLEP